LLENFNNIVNIKKIAQYILIQNCLLNVKIQFDFQLISYFKHFKIMNLKNKINLYDQMTAYNRKKLIVPLVHLLILCAILFAKAKELSYNCCIKDPG